MECQIKGQVQWYLTYIFSGCHIRIEQRCLTEGLIGTLKTSAIPYGLLNWHGTLCI